MNAFTNARLVLPDELHDGGLTIENGRIAPGQRADLIQVRLYEGLPVVRAVWRGRVRIG